MLCFKNMNFVHNGFRNFYKLQTCTFLSHIWHTCNFSKFVPATYEFCINFVDAIICMMSELTNLLDNILPVNIIFYTHQALWPYTEKIHVLKLYSKYLEFYLTLYLIICRYNQYILDYNYTCTFKHNVRIFSLLLKLLEKLNQFVMLTLKYFSLLSWALIGLFFHVCFRFIVWYTCLWMLNIEIHRFKESMRELSCK